MTGMKNLCIIDFKRMTIGLMTALFGVLFIAFANRMPVHAASGITVSEVNYDNSTVTFTLSEEDTRIYISDAKQKKWEYVPVAKDSNGKITMDISWIPVTKDYTLSVKGDVSKEPVSVVLPKQVTNFKVSYEVASGKVTFTNEEGRTVEWRKKNTYTWRTVADTDTLKSILDGLIANGATVIFRLAPEIGQNGEAGQRPGKEVSITIPKKTAAPAITVDDEKMTIAVTTDMEYRYTDKDGNPQEWIAVEKKENVPLSTIASAAIYITTGDNGEGSANAGTTSDVYLQFRNKASGSKQVSNNTTVMIPAQVVLTAAEKASFKYEPRSSSTFIIQAGMADKTNPYEYCIITKEGVTIDNAEELTWYDITSDKEISFCNTDDKYPAGSRIWIRRKATGSLGEDDYRIASDAFNLCPSISYPGDITAGSGCNLETVVGICRNDNPDGNLMFTFFSPANGEITRLKFAKSETESKELSSASFTSTVTENTGYTGENDRYIITTTITSTAEIESLLSSDESEFNVTLTGQYCVGNSAEFSDYNSSSLTLTISKQSKVVEPDESLIGYIRNNTALTDVDKIGFTKAVKRVYKSNKVTETGAFADANIFRILIRNALSTSDTSVSKLVFDGTVIPDGYYSTVSFEYTGNRYTVLELQMDQIESLGGITSRDENEKLYIYFDNDEIVSDATVNLMSSAKLKEGSTGATINPEDVEAFKSVTRIEDGVTTVIQERNRDYYIEYEVNIEGYEGLTVVNATWTSGQVSGTVLLESVNNRIYLNVEKIKNLGSQLSGTASANVVIEFSNGFTLNTGYLLTLIK